MYVFYVQERWQNCFDRITEGKLGTVKGNLLLCVGSTACGESTTKYRVQVHHTEDCSWQKDIPFLERI